jgi:hypothetical protein
MREVFFLCRWMGTESGMSDTPVSDEILEEGDQLMDDPDWMLEAKREFDEMVQGGGGKGFVLSTVGLIAVVVAMAFA